MKTLKRQPKRVLFAIIALAMPFIMSGCTSDDEYVSNRFEAVTKDDEIHYYSISSEPELLNFKKFKYTIEGDDLKGQSFVGLDFKIDSTDCKEITLKYIWNYKTTTWNVNKFVTLGVQTITTTGSYNQEVGIELEEDDYFRIQNNKQQFFVIEIEAEDELSFFIKDIQLGIFPNDDEMEEDEFDIDPDDNEGV